jgi:pSer/pThr/pTyr-binding forkhead associated (FHA) protein/S1-C subfamily serine protease
MAVEIHVQKLDAGPENGRELRFAKERLRIGRCKDNDIAIEGSKLSRYHAEIFVEKGGLRVRDLGSRNGTFVNGERIGREAAVQPADVVVLGDGGLKIKVALVAPPERANPGPATVTEAAPLVAPAATVVAPHQGFDLHEERPREKRDGVGQSTFFLAMGALQAQQRTRTQQLVALGTALLTVVVLVGAILIVFLTRRASDHSQEVARLEQEIQSGNERVAELEGAIKERDDAVEATRKQQGLTEEEREARIARTQKELADLRGELKKSQEAAGSQNQVWADLADRYAESVFLCVARTKEGAGFGTAFAVRENGVLATNAHVVQMFTRDANKLVVQNRTGQVFNVIDRVSNPDFKGVNSPDVGLLRIDLKGMKLRPLPLASDDELQKLRIGMQLGTLGYPGELAESYFASFDEKNKRFKSAVATFKDGWISQITNYNGEVADFFTSRRIQHSASLTGGTSGSPMFTQDGKVVALNNSSLDIVAGQGARKLQTKSAAQIGYAVRVDELRRFLERQGW